MPQEKDEASLPQEPKEPVTYASPLKRVWAWVGVGYMVILVLLTTWMYATGTYLTDVGFFMLFPALCGAAASALLLYRSRKDLSAPWRTGLLLFAVVFSVLAAAALLLGVPQLLRAMGV